MEQVYDNNGNKITGLYKSGDALVVKNDDLLAKVRVEKDRILRMNELESKVNTIMSDMNTIKSLLEKLTRE